MAEKNKNKNKVTAFEKEMVETSKIIVNYKTPIEANVVAILYKEPEKLFDINLTLNNFSENTWKVYFQIAHDIVLVEKKSSLDDITVGLYLEKHPKLKAKYEEYGGYNNIQDLMSYIKVENFDGYVSELRKWEAVLQLCKSGFPVKDRLSDYADMTEKEIYDEYETFLNHIFVNTSSDVKSYNVFEGMHDFIKEVKQKKDECMPFYNADLLNAEVGGFNLNGHIYGLGASSGVGKSTMAFNWVVGSAISKGEQVVMIINEEDENKVRKELLIWVANNIYGEELPKRTLRDGNINDKKTIELLQKCANWIEEKKDEQLLIVIPLERYSVDIAIKIIRKYSSGSGCRVFILDTLKESFDAQTDEIYKSMMRDMVKLYDTVKPSAKNVGLFVTYQLGKGSLKMRYLTNNEIGQAKSIVDVMSVNLQMRRPYEDEYEGGSKELKCYHYDGSNNKTKLGFKLKKEDNPMITFITKNRFGTTNEHQIISNCNLSTNVCEDVGFCNVPQDF